MILGIAVGVMIGFTGSSGVAPTVPAPSYMGLAYQQSVGASLFVDLTATFSTLAVCLGLRDVYERYAIALGLGATAGAQLGSHVAARAPKPLFCLSTRRSISPTPRRIWIRQGAFAPRSGTSTRANSRITASSYGGIEHKHRRTHGPHRRQLRRMFTVVLSAISDMHIRKIAGMATQL